MFPIEITPECQMYIIFNSKTLPTVYTTTTSKLNPKEKEPMIHLTVQSRLHICVKINELVWSVNVTDVFKVRNIFFKLSNV